MLYQFHLRNVKSNYHEPRCIQVEKGQKLVKSREDQGVEVTTKTPLPLPCQVAVPASSSKTESSSAAVIQLRIFRRSILWKNGIVTRG
jgi:hypothetical protein